MKLLMAKKGRPDADATRSLKDTNALRDSQTP
jgi:hypothetical protein